jgi:hypothetical protein
MKLIFILGIFLFCQLFVAFTGKIWYIFIIEVGVLNG